MPVFINCEVQNIDITQIEYNYVLIYDGDLMMWVYGIYSSYFPHPGRRTECTKRKKGNVASWIGHSEIGT